MDSTSPKVGYQASFGIAAAVLGAIGVAAGAFGAHSLKAVLEVDAIKTFETAVRYQLIHAIVLLFIAQSAVSMPGKWLRLSGTLFVLGVVLFSGSLYGLVLTDLRFFGPVTPIGGVCLVSGWLFLARAFVPARRPDLSP